MPYGFGGQSPWRLRAKCKTQCNGFSKRPRLRRCNPEPSLCKPFTSRVVFTPQPGRFGAVLALAVYLHRLRAGIAAMAASMGGLDVLVFTGGVGEDAPAVRERARLGLAFLGVEVDRDRNVGGQEDREIGAESAPVRTLMIAAREDLEIAHEVRAVLHA